MPCHVCRVVDREAGSSAAERLTPPSVRLEAPLRAPYRLAGPSRPSLPVPRTVARSCEPSSSVPTPPPERSPLPA